MSDILYSFLTAPESRSPVFVNEKTIAMISTFTGDPQIWTMDLDSKKTIQLTFGKERIWKIAADYSSSTLAFCMDIGGNENDQIFLMGFNDKEPRNITNEPNVRHLLGGLNKDRLLFADNARSSESFDICEINVITGNKRVILENSDHYNWPADKGVSPDGQWILYNKLKGLSDNSMWMTNTQTGETLRIGPDDRNSAETNPAWQSDSRGFFLLTDSEGEYVSVAHYDLDNREFQNVMSFDWDAETIALSYDGQYLAVTCNNDGYSDLKIFLVNGFKEVNFPKLPKGIISPYQTIHWHEHSLLFTLTTPDQPENVWILDIDKYSLEQLTNNSVKNVLKDNLVKPSLFRYKSFDMLEIPCWLYTPKGLNAFGLPIVIDIHGGPEGQELPGFSPFIQYLLTQGIAIAAPNVRGSTGYGKTYSHLDDLEKRLDSVSDIQMLVDYLVSQGIADKSRIAVMGVSYGGFMTLSCAARMPHLWACAVDTVGMFNLISFLENTAPYRRVHRESEYGSLAVNRDMLYEVSPIAKVDAISAPLMVIHGRNDPRVPVSEAEQVVYHLRNRGITVEYLCYEDEGHGIAKLKNKIDCYPQIAQFLKKYLGVE